MKKPEPAAGSGQMWNLPDRLAYVVSHSYPYSSNGYAVRSHQIARALRQQGHDVIVFNRPGRPWQIDGFAPATKVALDQTIDGVRYIFLPLSGDPTAPPAEQFLQAEQVLGEAFAVFRPNMVLAASNWETADPARRAAARHGCAFFYEQRGFWEMSRAFRDPAFAESDDYWMHRRRDTDVAQMAAGVFTLNTAMRDELIQRGVPAAKIHLVPNGLPDVSRPAKAAAVSRDSIGCTAAHLLGYIGSLSDYEGVGDLLQLIARLRGDGVDVAAMVVGSSVPSGLIGSQHPRPREALLQAQAQSLGVAPWVHFIPQVPENRIGAYYALIDAIILPRHSTPVTRLVPPLKPYTAAAYGVPVFMTDLPPLAEIAAEIGAHLFAPGDIAGLAAVVKPHLTKARLRAHGGLRSESLNWAHRIRPMARQFAGVAAAERRRQASLGHEPGHTVAPAAQTLRFDTLALPLVGLQALIGSLPLACLGPGRSLRGAGQFIDLTRSNILDVLATTRPGRFVIDWVGLQDDPGEWQGLWSADAMRLNRQIMDACRIGLDRGWRLQVIGPVSRARAPLFRTVAGALEDISGAPDTEAAI